MNPLQTKLKELDACDGPDGAIQWAKDYDTLQAAWDNCKRSDWMIWLVNKMGWSNDKDLRLMAVAFAREVQHLMKDQRSINALGVAERYANGCATIEELRAAREAAGAAWAAAREAAREAREAAEAAGSAGAAWAAAREAAREAREAAEAAGSAGSAGAAWGAAWAAGEAAWAAAGEAREAEQANIIRKYLPTVKF
jgi:hypothetical protein